MDSCISSSTSGWKSFLKRDQRNIIKWYSYLFCCFLCCYLHDVIWKSSAFIRGNWKSLVPFSSKIEVLGTWITNKPKFSKSQKFRLNSREKRLSRMKICFSGKFYLFNTIHGAKKPPPTSFSPVTSTNVGNSPQNFLSFNLNSFAKLVQNLNFVPSASPKLLNLNQDHSSKKAVFLVKSL